ncbi:hypothetical protein DSCO28_52270 [Desulfosarcina ovata subsp. sediminis]|uniref:Uncharacterized protein n=1 Tax=Desulfosarcina ovata subsp. sediminis TaxID=885957 RepID=A0A5K7ZX15_9BACT|nr:hypothetical protein DSCO28_52270 [Desulfosarcina ovata subsp. sediminis]
MAAIKDVDRLNDVAGVASSYEPKHGCLWITKWVVCRLSFSFQAKRLSAYYRRCGQLLRDGVLTQ